MDAALFLKIGADSSDLQREMKASSKSVNEFEDSAKSGGQAGGGLFGALGDGVGKVAMLAGGVGIAAGAIGGLVSFFGDASKASADEEQGIARLNAQLQASIPNWNGNTAAVDAAVNAAQAKAFSDDQARDSLAILVRATGDFSQAQKDQALAMDLARAKNIDLASASQIVANAEMGKLNSLKAVGVEITKGMSTQAALAALQQNVAGQADAYANTQAAATARIGMAWDNAKEDIGAAINQGLTPILSKLADFITSPAFQGAFEAIVGLLGTDLKIAFDVVGAAIDIVMPILQTIVGVITDFTTALQGTSDPLGGVTSGLSGLSSLIDTTVKPIVEAVLVQLAKFWIEIQPKLAAVWANIQQVIQTVWPIIQSVLQAGLKFVFDLWNNVWPGIQSVLSGVWDVIQGVVKVAWGVISGIIKVGLDILSGNWGAIWGDIQDALSTVWDGIKDIITGAWDIISGLFNVVLGELKTVWDTAWDGISTTVTNIWNSITSWVGQQIDEVKNKIALVTGAIKLIWDGFWDNVGKKVSEAWNGLVSTVKNFGDNIVGGIRDGFASAWNGFTGWIHDRLMELPEVVRNVLGIHSPSRVMAELGLNAAQGFLTGWSGGDGALLAAVGSTAAAMAGAGGRVASGASVSPLRALSSAAVANTPVINIRVYIDGVETSSDNVRVELEGLGTYQRLARPAAA
jgi:hypothetical protein